ncbi:hypothetical protein [Desulfovibrio litoralis]|uniref:Uncharacterized protein n=1 Tax=Desulfovibrio litoralis DSM 11393 TaxID=1121455 RepID=A0A1M7TAH5_9BACT|nr:hypothetical protein [Desulfovibrio litoralis]SHN67729.1 hypothetical protein SAMN02745728_01779 [Desulfovibrio litoralis DSM 11393]
MFFGKKDKKESKDNIIKDRYKREFVEFYCPRCQVSKIICVPEEDSPQCDICRQAMIMKEILTEGKY